MRAFCLLFAAMAMQCAAAPFSEWLEGRSPSGKTVRIWATGDEYSASFETTDGHAAVFDSTSLTYFYARQDGDGALVSTGIAVGDEVTADRDVLAAIPLHLRDTSRKAVEDRARRITKAEDELGISERWRQLKDNARVRREFEKKVALGQATDVLNAPPSSPTLGTIVGVTLLIDFPLTNAYGVVTNRLSQVSHPDVTPEKLSEIINGENCTLYGNASSVRKYYEDVSCDKLSYTNIVLGWFTAAHPREYYDDPTQDNGPSARELIGEVLSQIANADDYQTRYLPLLRQASYSGSYFRALNVWFAGPKAQTWSKGLWAHKWSLVSAQRNLLPVQTGDGVKYFNVYQISPVTSSPTIGTFCHENGHMICGFPDLYNYDTQHSSGIGDSAGLYSLMSTSGTTNPIYVDAYLRVAAGWVTPRELPSTPSVITVSNRLDCVWRYSNPSDSKQYYLIENRQKKGRDSNIPGGGILIWRCDETGDNTHPEKLSGFTGYAANRVSSELSLEQADGLYELEQYRNIWDTKDAWFCGNSAAGYGGVFNAESSPCAKWRDASNAGIFLSNFSEKDDVMTFNSGSDNPSEYVLTVDPNDGILVGSNFGNKNGTGQQATVTVTYGSNNYYDLGTATRTGYEFDGWWTLPTGGSQVYDATGLAVTGSSYWNTSWQWIYVGNLTVYAHWNTPGSQKPAATRVSISTWGSGANTSYIRVSWTNVASATSYNVYRSTTSTRPSSPMVTGVTGSYYYDYASSSGLTPGVKYYYWVESVNSAGSSFSNSDWGNILVPELGLAAWLAERNLTAESRAANGRTAEECYVLGLDPTDAIDDFRITSIEMTDSKPKVEWAPKTNRWTGAELDVTVKGAVTLEGSWADVPAEGNPAFRFFKAVVSAEGAIDKHAKVQLWAGGPYWAETNIGAEVPWESGYYFWWGDIVGYTYENNAWVASDGSSVNFSFSAENVPTYNKSTATLRSEGWTTADGVLVPKHDAAQVQWGGGWRMPTYQELYDLYYNKCDWTWTTMNGVNGYVVRGRGDYASASIFLPCAGLGYMASFYYFGSKGHYWSSVPYSDYEKAYLLFFKSDNHYTSSYGRFYGQTVRPVQGFTE